MIKNAINIQTAKTSEEARNLIKEHEKLRLTAYSIGDGKITIGWGHAEQANISKYKIGQKISEKRAEILFENDIKKKENDVKRIFLQWQEKGKHIKITQGMFDAMVSMAYNMGTSRLRQTNFIQHLENNNHIQAAKLIKISGISKKYPGLISRREKEYELFIKDL